MSLYNYNALAARGYNHDGKKGKNQVVVGLLADSLGEPVSIQVYRGNTNDLKTFGDQVDKIKKKLNVSVLLTRLVKHAWSVKDWVNAT